MAAPLDKPTLLRLARDGRSRADIAKILGANKSVVNHRLIAYGIKTLGKPGCKVGSLPRRCRFCGETDPTKFPTNRRLVYSICMVCRNKKYRLRNKRKREAAIRWLGGKCSRCGYDKCIGALHFHHRDPAKKDPTWKSLRFKALEKIEAEIAKCDLLCANCHAEEHWGKEETELPTMPHGNARRTS